MRLLEIFKRLTSLLIFISIFQLAYADNEAKIGDTEYATLAAAVESVAANNQETTILLLTDVNVEAYSDHYLDIQNKKNIVIDLQSHTIRRQLEEASVNGYVIKVSEGGTLTIQDTSEGASGTITGGWTTGNGGGIHNLGTFILKGGAITGNKAISSGTMGGGIYCSDKATLRIEGGEVSNNQAAIKGGGIHLAGSKSHSIANCTITGNTLTESTNGNGGGIFLNNGTLDITSCTIQSNTSQNSGGGIYINNGTVTFDDTKIVENVSKSNGGGIYSTANATLIIDGGEVSSNQTNTKGGGIYIAGGSANSISNCTIQGNNNTVNSGGYGAGVYVGGGTLTVTGCTIQSNICQNQGGGFYINAGTTTITNTSITGNSSYANATGAGVYLNNGTLTIDGGAITGNICTKADNKGTGLYYANGTLNMKGAINISGNYKDGNPKKENNLWLPSGTSTTNYGNVYLPTGKQITVTGHLTGSQIGVTLQTISNVFTSGLLNKGDETCFTSDNSTYMVGLNVDGEGILGKVSEAITLKFDANGGSGTMEDKTIVKESYVYLPESTFSPSAATLEFNGWKTADDGSGASYGAGDLVGPFSDNPSTIYAQWLSTTSDQAAIGEIQYATLAEAIAAVPTGGTTATTITLLHHVSNGGAIAMTSAEPKNIIINFSGFAYNVGATTTDAFSIGSGNTVTLTNGKLTADNATNIINNSGNLTLTDMDVTGQMAYSDQNAAITIPSGTYDITWSVDASLAETAKAGINISGGTFSSASAVPDDYCAEDYAPKDNGDGTYTVYKPPYVCQNTNTSKKYETLADAINDVPTNEANTIIMLADASSTGLITFPANKIITLDLKGKTISRSLTKGVSNGHVIKVAANATVTIEDTSGSKGKITGGWTDASNAAGSGGGINNEGILTLRNIVVTENKAPNSSGWGGGGVYSTGSSTITIENCEIINNEAGVKGGGIHISSNNVSTLTNCIVKGNNTTAANGFGAGFFIQRGTINITGCTFTENDGTNKGAGVYIDFDKGTSTVVTMNDVTVSNNTTTADGAGIYLNNGKLQVSGTINISGNKKGEVANNLYLPTGKNITVADALDASSRIGVTLQTVTDVFTTGLPGKGDETNFTSDNTDFVVGLNASGEAILGAPITISFDANGGTGTIDDIVFANGTTATLPACTFTPSTAGLGFLSWNTAADGSGTSYNANEKVSFTENTTLYAQWEYQAAIGDQKYPTLAEAIAAVAANGSESTTITLLRNISDGENITLSASEPKNIIIDFGGYTYNVSTTATDAFSIGSGSTVTLTNGTLTASNATNIINNSGNLTLTDMNVTGQMAYSDQDAAITITSGRYDITWSVASGLDEAANTNINISGGTFTSEAAVPQDYCATGYIPVDNGNGTYTVMAEPDYVCQNKGTGKKYATLAAGIASCKDAATDDEKTVVMIDDETIGSSGIAVAMNEFILDLNGHTVTGNLALYTTTSCVITDSSEGGTGGITNTTSACIQFLSAATLDIQGGTISGANYQPIDLKSGGTLNISGGTVTTSGNSAVVVESGSTINVNGGTLNADQKAIFNEGTCTINSGTITARLCALWNVNDGDAVINGGSLTSTGTYFAIVNQGHTTTKEVRRSHLKIYGGTIMSVGYDDMYSTDSVQIHGGTFDSPVSHASHIKNSVYAAVYKVYGGKYKTYDYNIHSAIKDHDKTLSKEPIDGYYQVVDREVMCKIGDQEFRSIDTAIKYEHEGEIIKVVRDVDDGHGIELNDAIKGLNIVIDFDGHTYQAVTRPVGTGSETSNTWSQVMHYGNDNTLTLKNGSIKVKEGQGDYFPMFMQNYGDLTLENMTFDARNLKYKDILFNFNSGSSVIKGKTKIIFDDLETEEEKAYGAMTLNMGGGGNYPNGASLRIEGNEVEILGNITVKAGTGNAGSKAGLSINGGYFQDFVIMDPDEKLTDKVAISGGTYALNDSLITADRRIDKYCIEKYCACDHREAKGDTPETWTVRWPVPELDGNGDYAGYSRTEDKAVTSAYYTRSFSKNVTGNYQCWFVPFDYVVTEDDAEDYDFYTIDSTTGLGGANVINITKCDVGDQLDANTPCVVKPKKVETHGFASPYAKTLKAKNVDCVAKWTAGDTDFSFYGVYERTYATEDNEWLTVSVSGTSFWSYAGDDVKPFRWIVKTTDAATGARRMANFVFSETPTAVGDLTASGHDGQEARPVAYYSLDGRWLTAAPQQGLTVVRFSDGSSRVMNIKNR